MDEIEVIPASGEDWHAFIARAGQPDGATERVVLEVHQRLLAVESEVRFARAAIADGLSPVEAAPQAQSGVTYEELVCLLREVEDNSLERLWKSSNPLQARHLLAHPRLGPLLRGEGAPAPLRVVLPEEPPFWRMPFWRRPYIKGPGAVDALARAVWAAARAEVERQQGGQADG